MSWTIRELRALGKQIARLPLAELAVIPKHTACGGGYLVPEAMHGTLGVLSPFLRCVNCGALLAGGAE